MSELSLARMTAPGLPSWPWLLFDAKSTRAMVSFRLATWRSWTRAHRVSVGAGWIANLLAGWWVWASLSFVENPLGRGMLALMGCALAGAVTGPLFPIAFNGFLARQILASRGTVWFTPDGIAFRSPLYANGVMVWRSWKGHPLQTRFELAPDPEAAERRMTTAWGRIAHPKLQTAHVLRLVITSFDPYQAVKRTTQANVVRSIPVVEVDLIDAQKLTVVLSAAAALTARASTAAEIQIQGVDIDVVNN